MDDSEDDAAFRQAETLDDIWAEEVACLISEKSSGTSDAILDIDEVFVEEDIPGTSKRALYASYCFATWGWRTWEFAVVLILLHFQPKSLRLVSVYGILESLVKVLSGSFIGSYIDRMPRLRGACTMYILQNSCIVISAVSAAVYVVLEQSLSHQVKAGLITLTIGAGAASSIGSMGVQVAVEREWVKALCGTDSFTLTHMNAGMRALDMACLLLAPLVSGALMTYAGLQYAVLVILVFNLLAAVPETLLLRHAWAHSTNLRQPKPRPESPPAGAAKPKLPLAWSGWSTYAQQRVVLPAVALALLHCTVLSLGYQMTSYLTWRNVSEVQVAAVRGFGALSGLSSTFAFPPISDKLGMKGSGLMGILWQLLWLLMGVAPVAAHQLGFTVLSVKVEMMVLLVGLVMSRFGLWLFDLSVSQMLQELVPSSQLGMVNGVQGSLSSALEVAAYSAGLVLHRPQDFVWMMMASCGFVAAATALYIVFLLLPDMQYHNLESLMAYHQ